MTPPLGVLKEEHTHYCVLVEKFDFEKFLIGGVPSNKGGDVRCHEKAMKASLTRFCR